MVSVSSAHVAAACAGREGAACPRPRPPKGRHLGVGGSCQPGMRLITRTSHAAPGSTRPCGIGPCLRHVRRPPGDTGLPPPPSQDVSAFKSQKM